MTRVRGNVHNLVGMVDFEETERERDRCQYCDHCDVSLFGLEDLLRIAAVALHPQVRVSR